MLNPCHMDIANLIKGAPDTKEAIAWLTKWYADKVDLEPSKIKELVIDGNTVFPVLHGDNIDSILHRFGLLFPVLSKISVEHVKNMKLYNEDGTTNSGYLRALVSIPPILRAILCTAFGQDCLTDKEFLKSFSRKAPKFFLCNHNKM